MSGPQGKFVCPPRMIWRFADERDGGRLYLLLDMSIRPDMRSLIYAKEAQPKLYPLYLHTSYQELMHLGPVLVSVTRRGELWKWYVEEGAWQDVGVAIAADVPLKSLAVHLQQFLEVEIASGRICLLRYFDPQVLWYAGRILLAKGLLRGSMGQLYFPYRTRAERRCFIELSGHAEKAFPQDADAPDFSLPYLDEEDMAVIRSGAEEAFARRLERHLRAAVPACDPAAYREEIREALALCKDLGLRYCSTISLLAEILLREGALPEPLVGVLRSSEIHEAAKRMKLEEFLSRPDGANGLETYEEKGNIP